VDHLAIDIGGRNSQFCLRSSNGDILREGKVATSSLPTLLKEVAASRVVFETCAECHWLADVTKEAGHEVRVVPSTLVKALGVGSRSTKNDKKDARVLSEASCRIELPSIHLPSKQARERKTLLSMRDSLVASRTKMINAVRGWLRGQAIRISSGTPEAFPKRVRATTSELPADVDATLKMIDELTGKLVELERTVRVTAKNDDRCRRMMSTPGVGPVTVLDFTATLDTTERFANAHRAQAYLGLTPGEYASGDKNYRLGITKAGSARMRWLLVQSAWAAWRSAPEDPMVLWAKQVAHRRGKKVAIVALARKLAGVLFAIWRDGTLYSPPAKSEPEVMQAAE
jgi:transposase